MRVVVRLILVAGAAASVALLARERIAAEVARVVAEPAAALVVSARGLVPTRVEATTTSPPPIVAAPPPLMTVADAPQPPPLPKKKSSPSQPQATPTSHVVTKSELEQAIATRVSGARAIVARDDAGAPLGLALHGVGALARFGVRDGDILVSANGHSLRTADEALAALGKLQNATHVTVTFRRGSGSYSVAVDLVD